MHMTNFDRNVTVTFLFAQPRTIDPAAVARKIWEDANQFPD